MRGYFFLWLSACAGAPSRAVQLGRPMIERMVRLRRGGCYGCAGCRLSRLCRFRAGAGFALSRTVLPTDEPAFRVARMDSDKDVTMKTTADTVVALERSVAEPRGPNAVCDPMPPNAPARSAAFPLCKSTTIMRNTHTST